MSIKNMFSLLEKIALEKGVSKEKVIEILKTSIEKAYLKENPDVVFEAVLDPEKETIKLFEKRVVVEKSEDEIDDDKEINLSEAQQIKKSYKLGDVVEKEVDITKFERRVAGHVAQVLGQNINEISSKKVYEEWKDKVGFIIKAEVEKNDDRLAWVNLGDTKGVVLKADQIPNENLEAGKSYLFLIKKVEQQSKGWQIILSRADERLLKFILSNEVSEIKNGIIEIKKIARIVGYKTKVALVAHQQGIDAVGITVGPRGDRIKNISQQLNNERIDVILYDEDPRQFLVNACHPEKIIGLEISEDEDNPHSKLVTIVCEEASLSKLIGKNGINIKLLNKLTGWQIDIISKEIAIEDEVKYEDVSSFVSSKSKPTKTNFKPYQKQERPQRNFEFANNFMEDTTFDNEYEAISGITDEDVENLINFDASTNSKKKKKNKEDDEEIVLVAGNSSEYEDEMDVDFGQLNNNESSNEDSQVESAVEEIKEEKVEEPVKITKSTYDFDEEEPKKAAKTPAKKKTRKAPKEKEEKPNIFDELMEEDVVDFQEEENNVDDLDNLELDEE